MLEVLTFRLGLPLSWMVRKDGFVLGLLHGSERLDSRSLLELTPLRWKNTRTSTFNGIG